MNNFRLLFDLRAISVGVIITRCDHLQTIFKKLGRGDSYGQSTTHLSKLVPRIEGGGGAGCPILAFGITNKLYDETPDQTSAAQDFLREMTNGNYNVILADLPWRFTNRIGNVAPEHKRLNRYGTLFLKEIKEIPVAKVAADQSHLYLWVPNALIPEGLEVMKAWGFNYKTNIVWHKIRKDGGPDGRGVGFYFRNTTEVVLFGIRGKLRTLQPGRSQVNIMKSRKQEHSRKPDELYRIIEECSPGPYLELFARGGRPGWSVWGNQAEDYAPDWPTYKNHSQVDAGIGKPHQKNQFVLVS